MFSLRVRVDRHLGHLGLVRQLVGAQGFAKFRQSGHEAQDSKPVEVNKRSRTRTSTAVKGGRQHDRNDVELSVAVAFPLYCLEHLAVDFVERSVDVASAKEGTNFP